MKRIGALFLAVIMCCTLTACKSKDVKAAEDAIAAIGEVTMDSKDAIANAEKLFNILTDSEKSSVNNRLDLVEAKEAFESLQGEAVYKNAKEAYEKLNDVSKLCENGMDDIYGAWYFGIYKADDASSRTLFTEFASETPHLTSKELSDAAKKANVSEWTLMGDWNACVLLAEAAIALRGDYDTIDAEMKVAEDILQKLTSEYDDYTYYPKLKDYYSAVSSYVDFFLSPSGSFKQLSDTVNNYETNIRTYQSDVGFLFTKG